MMVAGNCPREFPTIREVLKRVGIPVGDEDDDDGSGSDSGSSSTSSDSFDSDDSSTHRKPRRKRRKKRHRARGVNFTVGFTSRFWGGTPIHATLKRLRKKYGLRWLRILMAYRRFPNVRELYRGDLDLKLNKGLTSEETRPRPCNCIAPNKRDGKCVYEEKCRVPCFVYKIKCRHCKRYYIGNTSDHFKSRVAGHCSDACSVLNKLRNQRSTACSRHFIKHVGISHPDGPPYGSSFRSRDIRCVMEPSLITTFNGIGAMKSFGKRRCLLCNAERAQIVKARNGPKRKRLLNKDLRFGVGCPHITKFHTFRWDCK